MLLHQWRQSLVRAPPRPATASTVRRGDDDADAVPVEVTRVSLSPSSSPSRQSTLRGQRSLSRSSADASSVQLGNSSRRPSTSGSFDHRSGGTPSELLLPPAPPVAAAAVDSIVKLSRRRNLREHYEMLNPIGRGSFSRCVLTRHSNPDCMSCWRVCPPRGGVLSSQADFNCSTCTVSSSFVSVYACKSRTTGDVCAAKLVNKRRFRLLPAFKMETLFREAEILMRLKHPNIIRVIDVFDEDDDVVIITEYAQGGELFETLVEHGNFSEATARAIMRQALDAVSYLHRHNIVHRDLKPENMLLFDITNSGGHVHSGSAEYTAAEHRRRVDDPSRWVLKLSDFGVARSLERGASASTFCGSPQYVAPEVLSARDSPEAGYSNGVDTWSLGVILYVMLCGYLPFDQAVHGTTYTLVTLD
jgi:hypothetical protein